MRGILIALALLAAVALLVVLFTAEGGPADAPKPPGDTPPRSLGKSADPGLPRIEPEEGSPADAQDETGTVEGIVVTADGQPFTDAIEILLSPAGGADLPEVSARSPGALDGAFTMTRVPPGRYRALVHAVGTAESGASEAFAVDADHPVRDLRIVVRPVGSISGVVLRLDSGEPVAGAQVESVERFARARRVFSDSNGRFELADLTPRKHVLEVTAEGFAEGRAEDVEVVAGLDTSGVVVRLGFGGTIRGIIYGPDGMPSPGAKVVLVPAMQGMRIVGNFGPVAVADETGAYRFEYLTPGRYRVGRPTDPSQPVVLVDDSEGEEKEAEPFLAVDEGEVVTFDVRSDLLGAIAGTIRDRAGEPLRRQVNLLDAVESTAAKDGPPRFQLPNEEGEFSFVDIPPGEYVLESDGGRTPVTVRASRTTPVELVFETGRIEGVVVDESGKPVEGTKVWLHRLTSSFLRVQVEVMPSGVTDAEGGFRFAAVTAGRYRLQFGLGPTSSSSETLEIGPGEVRKGVVLRLERPIEVRIVVLSADGAPLTGIAVQLGDMNGETDGDGAVGFRAVPGTHPVIVGTPPEAVLQVVRVERSGSQTFRITRK